DAQDGHGAAAGGLADAGQELLVDAAELGTGDGARQRGAVAGEDLVGGDGAGLPQVGVAGLDDGVDHARQAQALAVLGREDGDARAAQALDLVVDDDATAAADDLDVLGAALA